MTCKIETLPQRFAAKVDRRSPEECWPWTGCILANGYGQIGSAGNERKYAHRVAYELANGPIEDGLVIDHLCRQRNCCNPHHLQAVSNRTNILRGVGPSAVNSRASTCINGHPLEGANVRTDLDGHRVCRACRRSRATAKRSA